MSAARGETKLELEKLKSAFHDARRALDRENHECTYRKRMDKLAAEQRAELASMKLKLAESEAQQVALSTSLSCRLHFRRDDALPVLLLLVRGPCVGHSCASFRCLGLCSRAYNMLHC